MDDLLRLIIGGFAIIGILTMVVSAVTQADIQAATLAGAQGYISKPFDPDDLVKALRTALNVSEC